MSHQHAVAASGVKFKLNFEFGVRIKCNHLEIGAQMKAQLGVRVSCMHIL